MLHFFYDPIYVHLKIMQHALLYTAIVYVLSLGPRLKSISYMIALVKFSEYRYSILTLGAEYNMYIEP